MAFPNSFGGVVPVTGPLVGFLGNISRMGSERTVVARPVLPTTATPLQFGEGAVNIGNSTNGNYQSLRDYLGANAANAQNLQRDFAGVAARNVRTQGTYLSYGQTYATPINTTGTASSGSTSLVVASATGIQIGQSVEGAGIQPGTLVTAVSGTTITLSPVTTAALSTTTVSFTTPIAGPVVGSYPQGVEGEVLLRGSITVSIAAGSVVENAAVYIRTVANANIAGTFVGDFEAAADLATSAITIGTTIGSTALTTSAGTGLAVGQMITGPGIPANTYLVSGATTSWVMSQAALATIASGGAMSAYNTALLGTPTDPFLVFRTGQIDSNNVSEVTLKNRHSA